MTAERRLPSMHGVVGSPSNRHTARQYADDPVDRRQILALPEKGRPEQTVCQQHRPTFSTTGTADAKTVTRELERTDQSDGHSADRPRGQKTRNEKTKEETK